MNNKHAYLIMAHNDFGVLAEILKELDNERNDIFLHIDVKASNYSEDSLKSCVTKGKLYFVPRMNVNWGGYSQIACELHLMEQAKKEGEYQYYHLLTGATFPIKTQSEILEFFDSHNGYEFIGFNYQKDFSERVQKYNVFNETGKSDTKIKEIKSFCRNKFRGLQKKLNYIYPPARGINFKKGFVYWSLTHDAVKYILSKKAYIEKVFKHSFCGDELFIQTILYNSKFKDKIYNLEDEYASCLRYVKPVQSWKAHFSGSSIKQSNAAENSIVAKDIDDILKTDNLFALKFVSDEGIKAIEEIRRKRGE